MRRLLALLLVVAPLTIACAEDPPPPGPAEPGQALYESQCAACHGVGGAGTSIGPPLIVTMYAPADFPDESVAAAIRNGAAAGKWEFGPMPKIAGLTDQQIADVVGYMRRLQETAGIR